MPHDAYYRDQPQLSFEERSQLNYDHPNSLETRLMVKHIKQLLKGQPVHVPVYDFTTHRRTDQTVLVEPAPIILVDGILIFTKRRLRELMDIPVFHDDQHGTAIISAAAMLNGLKVVGKKIDEIKVVCSGAGAAAISCLNLWCQLGVSRENVTVCDSKGVIYRSRDANMEPTKARYARETADRTLGDAMVGADIFLGLSAAGVLKPEMVAGMAEKPMVFALANPIPEIMPELAREVRPDVIIATGRSDYVNQVNNVLCFPFIFRGALDVGATRITEEMKMASVRAIADLAEAEVTDEVAMAYPGHELSFGPEYLIPKPFDPRLIVRIAPAVARAAIASGVATRPITDWHAYDARLSEFVYHTGVGMRAIFQAARQARGKRIIYAEGEDERVLRAAQIVVEERFARPILIGRPSVIEHRLERANLRIRPGVDFDIVNPESDERYRECWTAYHKLMVRHGVTPSLAKEALRRKPTVIGAILLKLGYADGLLCGMTGQYKHHLGVIRQVIGKRPGVQTLAAMDYLMLPGRSLFICDTHINDNPSAEEVAEMTLTAADQVRRFGIHPKVALLSHSNFGSSSSESARKMGRAAALLCARSPHDLEIDGEMRGDSALSDDIRREANPESPLKGEANLLVMPNIDAANIAFNLLKMTGGEGVTIGPILLGAARPVHVMTSTSTVRRLVNMTALAVVESLEH